jgi:tripartite-type tricarboxylate transporter receptor subunit TctC
LTTTKALIAGFLLAATSFPAAAAPAATATDYPARPAHIIVGFAAGGAPDTLARVIGEKLGEALGQPFVIENRTGAQGNTAMVAVAKACRSAMPRSIRH